MFANEENAGEKPANAGIEVEAPSGVSPVGETPIDSEDYTAEDFSEWLDSAENVAEMPFCAENGGETDENLPNETVEDDTTAECEAKPEDLAAQLEETRDQLLRKAADFDNFRKRINQEKQNAIDFANKSLLLDIIPIIDDFERAIQSAQASAELAELPAGKAMLDGIAMIEKRLLSQLESKWGLKQFNSAGEPFDPNIHEAMLMEKSPDVEEPVVQEDFAKGYMLKDKVIRAAKVKVLMPDA
jgi:molecular chaperone GrpE